MNKAIFNIDNKRVWVAGSRGLVGTACISILKRQKCVLVNDPHRTVLDLRNEGDVYDFIQQEKPDVIVLAAAKVGGIGDNAVNGDAFYHENRAIQNAVINAAAQNNVEKLVFLGSSCIYPRDCPQPIQEKYLETGALEKTNEGYARAKIEGIRLCQEHRRNGHDFISLMPCNLYGENDHFISGARPHVIPALIMKLKQAIENKDSSITVWGTGKPLREFMHVDDLAGAIVHALRHYSKAEPLNVGSGSEVSINELVRVLCNISGYKGNVVFDSSMPDGTPRKILDSSKMRSLGWMPKISLQEGLSSVWRQASCQG